MYLVYHLLWALGASVIPRRAWPVRTTKGEEMQKVTRAVLAAATATVIAVTGATSASAYTWNSGWTQTDGYWHYRTIDDPTTIKDESCYIRYGGNANAGEARERWNCEGKIGLKMKGQTSGGSVFYTNLKWANRTVAHYNSSTSKTYTYYKVYKSF